MTRATKRANQTITVKEDIVDRRGRRRNTTLAKVLRFIKSKLRKVKEKV